MLSSNGTALLAHVSTNLLFVCNCNDLPSPQPQVCLSPHHNNYDETVGTLRFAERAKTIKNKVKHHSHKQPYAPSHQQTSAIYVIEQTSLPARPLSTKPPRRPSCAKCSRSCSRSSRGSRWVWDSNPRAHGDVSKPSVL